MIKLVKIETFTNQFVCFVKITTSEGHIGWGQVAPYQADITVTVLHRMVAPHALGLDALDIDAFKFRVGAECGHDVDEWPGRTESIVPVIRNVLGAETALLVDGNSGFLPARAIEVGQVLQDNGVSHFEKPCPYWEYHQTKQVTDALDIDVTGGEQDCELQNWQYMIDLKAVDIVQPGICYLGGMTRTLRVAKMADTAGIPVTPH